MKKTYSKFDLGRSFGLTVCVMLCAQTVLSLCFSSLYDTEGNLPNWAFWLMQALYSLCGGLASIIYAKCAKADFLSATSANKKPVLSHIVWGFAIDLCLICAMIPLNSWVLKFLQNLTGKTYSVEMPMELVPMLLIACLLPAFTEEFTFRGTIAQSLRNCQTISQKLGALVLSGALFAVIHFNPAQTLHQTVLGAMLTLVMFRSGSIWTAVALHLFNNVAAVALSFAFSDSVLELYYMWMFVLGTVFFALSIWGYIASTKSHWRAEEISNTRTMRDKTSVDADLAVAEKVDVFDTESKIYFGISLGICALIWALTLFV